VDLRLLVHECRRAALKLIRFAYAAVKSSVAQAKLVFCSASFICPMKLPFTIPTFSATYNVIAHL
jgi:hypothetical protein